MIWWYGKLVQALVSAKADDVDLIKFQSGKGLHGALDFQLYQQVVRSGGRDHRAGAGSACIAGEHDAHAARAIDGGEDALHAPFLPAGLSPAARSGIDADEQSDGEEKGDDA